MKHFFDKITSDFTCKHCRMHISTDPGLSGVNNRNHCPYCLHSRHMDHFEPGDRLSPCKAEMRPIALTFKRTRNKYGSQRGELMVIHQCVDCGKVSANRIAADDLADAVYEIFRVSLRMDGAAWESLRRSGISPAGLDEEDTVRVRLFGRERQYA